MKKVALFDFCETLVNRQTGDEFIGFTLRKYKRIDRYLLFLVLKSRILVKLLDLLSLNTNFKLKYVKMLKGFTQCEIDKSALEYVNKICMHNLIQPVFDRMLLHHDTGLDIWIVSGGYAVYIEKFFPQLSNKVIANVLEFNNGRATGKLVGQDCMGLEKINRINSIITDKDVKFVISYSDSESDLPMMKMSDNGIVVSKNNSQLWAKKNGFNEIIWFR